MEPVIRTPIAGAAPIRAPKVADLVASNLRRQIVRGELAEGAVLPNENELMEHFAVSRPTLREAFRVLESEGLIRVLRGSNGGARVQRPEPAVGARFTALLLQMRGTTLEDVQQARMVLEPAAVRMLAEKPTKKAISALRAAVAAEEAEAGRPMENALASVRFHETIMELAGNTTLAVLAGMLHEIVESAYTSAVDAAPSSEEQRTRLLRYVDSHRKVIDLIESGEPERAEKFWRNYLAANSRYLYSWIPAKSVVDLLQ
ncbi:FCD domain-containing protein [Mycolicibacterium sp. 3033]|nr:FCD domain-containing protein [Mycolicibacterium aurantiacum]